MSYLPSDVKLACAAWHLRLITCYRPINIAETIYDQMRGTPYFRLIIITAGTVITYGNCMSGYGVFWIWGEARHFFTLVLSNFTPSSFTSSGVAPKRHRNIKGVGGRTINLPFYPQNFVTWVSSIVTNADSTLMQDTTSVVVLPNIFKEVWKFMEKMHVETWGGTCPSTS